MPKVADEYINGKKDFILACIEKLLKEKPLYQITMRDIINVGSPQELEFTGGSAGVIKSL